MDKKASRAFLERVSRRRNEQYIRFGRQLRELLPLTAGAQYLLTYAWSAVNELRASYARSLVSRRFLCWHNSCTLVR